MERTLTINDVGLSLKEDSTATSLHQTPMHAGGLRGIGSHQYAHNTPVDYVIDANEHIQSTEVENHDDFYVLIDERIHVQDQKGIFIMYDAALADFRCLFNLMG